MNCLFVVEAVNEECSDRFELQGEKFWEFSAVTTRQEIVP